MLVPESLTITVELLFVFRWFDKWLKPDAAENK